jgi:hypothetical protein
MATIIANIAIGTLNAAKSPIALPMLVGAVEAVAHAASGSTVTAMMSALRVMVVLSVPVIN